MDVMVVPQFNSDRENPNPAGTVSVIIPIRNDLQAMSESLNALRFSPEVAEVIIVDASDQDQLSAEKLPSDPRIQTLFSSVRGRAQQMNLGASKAQGDVFLFLHADTTLPSDGIHALLSALSDDNVVGGAFRVRLSPSSPGLRLIGATVNWRSRWLKAPFGDQGIFVRAKSFRELNGYGDLPIMEDVDLVRRLRQLGKLALLPAYVSTSARRWQANGICRTTAVNWSAQLMWKLGRNPQKIRRFYDRHLRRDPSD